MIWERRTSSALAAALVLGAIGANTSFANGARAASDRVERVELFLAEALVIEGVAATLTVVGQERAGMALTLQGTEEALAQIEREVRGGALYVGAPHGQNVVSGDAAVVVGGLEAQPMPEIRIEVPKSAPLALAGLVGEIEVIGVDGPVELALAHGRARLDQVHDGRLSVAGNGEIGADRATGDLAVEVQGAGQVRIANARLERLKVEIAGAGGVVVDGSAEEGRLSVAGIGTIHVDEIRARPQITRAGLGEIEVGNW